MIARMRELAPRLCDRHLGIGADGVLVVASPVSPRANARMIVVNADGSRPQMCGNGLRCVALWLSQSGASERFAVETDAGVRACAVEPDRVTVDMGPAERLGAVRPGPANGRSFARVSMGNPHAVAFVERGEDPELMARALGPVIERDADFPEGTNVELARVETAERIVLWVWERGCGITAACGTGACATVAAAVDEHLVPADSPVTVVLPGGELQITVPASIEAGVTMTGPARIVFDGRWSG
jgi:diaminopimelate epimerase